MKRFLISLLVFFGLAFIGYTWFQSQLHVKKGEVEIFQGASAKQIASLLEEYDIIANGDIFYYYIRLNQLYYKEVKKEPEKFPIDFKHGTYAISKGDFQSLITELNEQEPKKLPTYIITIPEGSTVEQIAEIVADTNYVSQKTFLAYINNPDTYRKFQKKYEWLPPLKEGVTFPFEGYLQANTYYFPQAPDLPLILTKMLDETNGWFERNKELIDSSGFTFSEILTLASVVEKESKFTEDRPKVAQVFLNRLKKDMKLESDITAIYAHGEHKTMLTLKDIEIDSPYNTYVTKGLPLGPINSPSSESFVAVLKPAGKTFKSLYFYAKPDGKTFYAETFEEHEANRIKFEPLWKEISKE